MGSYLSLTCLQRGYCAERRRASNTSKEQIPLHTRDAETVTTVTVDEDTKPQISESDTQILKCSWECLKSNITKVGVVIFARLFETHPDVQNSFMEFRDMSIEDMHHSQTLREHGLRVMTTVEKVLSRIDDEKKLESFLSHLGNKHVSYNANKNYIQLVGPEFVRSIKSELQEVWTPETEKAWYKLFELITYYMRKGMTSVST